MQITPVVQGLRFVAVLVEQLAIQPTVRETTQRSSLTSNDNAATTHVPELVTRRDPLPFGYAALRHPEHAAVFQRVLATRRSVTSATSSTG